MQDVIYKTNIPNGYMVPVTSSIANPTILLEKAIRAFGLLPAEL